MLENEALDAAAVRELREETGVTDVYLEQLYTFGEPKRDPRGRVITVAYYALAPYTESIHAGTDASEAAWFRATDLPPLAFDHRKIVEYARQRLRNKLDYTNAGFELLPAKFTLTELQRVHEAILGESLDKRNFRRKITQKGIVKPLNEWLHTGRKAGPAVPVQHARVTAGYFSSFSTCSSRPRVCSWRWRRAALNSPSRSSICSS